MPLALRSAERRQGREPFLGAALVPPASAPRRPVAESAWMARGANLHFVGSVAETYAISIPADLLLFDEYDRLALKQIPKFEQRLAALTSMKLIRRFSTPTYPEWGIDEC